MGAVSGVDLVQWLGEQLNTDERIAHAACWDDQSAVWTARPPRASYERYTVVDYLGDGVVAVTPENADADGVGPHVAEHDPARVLREIDAKREILARYEELRAASKEADLIGDVTEEYQDFLLPMLALPYADRPGYQEAWRP